MKTIIKMLSLMLFVGLVATHAQADIRIIIKDKAGNIKPLATPAAPFKLNDAHVMVPMRELFDVLGASVSWDGSTQAIAATASNGTTINLQIGNSTALINGQSSPLDAPPLVQGGSTLVPLRFVAQALGCTVDWDEANQLVTVSLPN